MFQRKALVVLAGVSALALSSCSSPQEGDTGAQENGPVTLTFQSLAFQPELVAANERIVEEWNEANPEIQVELTQGDWGSVHDQLTASFEGGTAPDLMHYETDRLRDFAERGNILDLEPYLTPEFQADIRDSAWESVKYDTLEGTWGVPILQEVWALYADQAALSEAGIELPTVDDPWHWDDYATITEELTIDENNDGNPERYGGGFPLGNPATRILPLAGAFGGHFFEIDGDTVEGVFGEGEKELISRIHDMLYVDKSISPDILTQGPSGSVTGFVEGNYATLVAPIHLRQALEEGAPESFDWVMLPPLVGESSTQAAATQTISVASSTDHPEEAVAFLEYLTSAENQVEFAQGDMLLPASEGATEILKEDEDESWDAAIAAIDDLEVLPYQKIPAYQAWVSRVGTPAMERYFANTITLDELGETLVTEGNDVLERYTR